MDKDFIVPTLNRIIRTINHHLVETLDMTGKDDKFDEHWDGSNDMVLELINLKFKIYHGIAKEIK